MNILTGESKNHRDIIKKFNLPDDRIRNRNFVRVRVMNNKGTVFYGLDDPNTLPDWFVDNQQIIEKKCLYYMKKGENYGQKQLQHYAGL